MKTQVVLFLALVVVDLILQPIGWTQTSSGTITGSVADPSGLPVPGAEIKLISEQTGESRILRTNETGDFVFTSVLPGRYAIIVQLAGFKQLEKTGLVLTSSERLSAGILRLAVGGVSEEVSVEADVTPVQTTSVERSALLNDKQIETLMTRGRDFMSLLRVLPGVVMDSGGNESLGTMNSPTIHGIRNDYNLMTIDGVIGNTRGLGTLDTPLNLDAISEVKVLQANYQAEYGKTAGAIITVVSKSGGKEFHGAGYLYKRHEQFNANSFFNNLNGLPRPIYRYTTIGYNIGGPINKEKLFFFFSQEILPNKRPNDLRRYTVPTQAERNGDFSQTVDLNGARIAIRDPNTGQNFKDNIIPPERINKDTQKLLNLFPLPNFLDRSISKGNYNYVISDSNDTPVRQEVLRIDYKPTDKWHVVGRSMTMGVDNRGNTTPGNSNINSGIPWGGLPLSYKTTNPNFALNATYFINATTVNEVTIGFARWTEEQRIIDQAALDKLERDKIGITLGQLFPKNNPLNLVPRANFGGVPNAASFAFDGRFPMNNAVTSISITDGLSKVHGPHTFKFGVDLQGDRYLQSHTSGGSSFSGNFDFGRNTQNPLDTNYAYSNALLGVFNTYSEGTARPDYFPTTKVVEWYAQDNWKAAKKLTLDYGVRVTWALSQTVKTGGLFIPNRYDRSKIPALYQPALQGTTRVARNPLTGEIQPAAFIGAFVSGSGDPYNGSVAVSDPSYPGIMSGQGILAAPRLGFAYDVFGDGKTALRGGFGIFYNARPRSGQAGDLTFNPPVLANPQQFYGRVDSILTAGSVIFPSSINRTTEHDAHMLSTYNMSLGIQRNIGFGTVVDVAYVSTLGRHLGQTRNINLVASGSHFLPQNLDSTTNRPLPDDFFRPYVGYGNIPYLEFAGTSNYHALETQINRRFSKGLQFGASWTWSKTMNFSDGYDGTVASYVPIRAYNYGKASFDRTHNLQINWLWNIPNAGRVWDNRMAKVVLENWQISGIASFISGPPCTISNLACGNGGNATTYFTTVDGADITGGGDAARVVLTGSPVLPRSERTFAHYFNTSVIARPAQGTIGNAPKDVFRGPGVNNWDMSLFKNFPLREKVTLQFRWETYNTFNHTQFQDVDNTARFDAQGRQVNARFGQVTSARDPRRMQFAVRLSF